MTDYSALLPPHWKDEVKSWLRDDAPSFDIGGLVVGTAHEEASLYAKSDGVLAGVPFFDATFESLGCVVEWHLKDVCVMGCPENLQPTPLRVLYIWPRTASSPSE